MTSCRSPRAAHVLAVGAVREQRVEDGARARQRIRRLEQRHHVEDRRASGRRRPPTPGRARRSRPTDRRVNETTTRWQAATPCRAWIAPIARNVARTSPSDTPGLTSWCVRRSRGQRRERGSMHAAVLANLDRGQVEPERPELPAQLRDLTERHAPHPVARRAPPAGRRVPRRAPRGRRSARPAGPRRRSARCASGAAARR